MNLRWQLAQWAEIQWWKRYLKKREPQAYLEWKFRYWSDFLERTKTSPAPGARILDAGCGPAGIFMALSNCQIDALDPLLDHYAALPHFEPKNYPWTDFHAEDLENHSIGAIYDQVFCLNALNHMRDIPGSVRKLFRALKPGGKLVVSVDAHNKKFLRSLFRSIPMDVLHPFQEDLSGYRKLFFEEGFFEFNAICYKKGLIFDYWILVLSK